MSFLDFYYVGQLREETETINEKVWITLRRVANGCEQ
jgi:hypothetical protein